MIGREHELALACTLLRRPEVRLLPLTSTGGVDKTRLAEQVATELLDDFANGICFVSLAPISDADRVLSTLARNLGQWEVGDRSPLEHLKEYLHEQQLLLGRWMNRCRGHISSVTPTILRLLHDAMKEGVDSLAS